MFLIECPFCGLRDESEFRCGGEAHIARPAAPATLTDREWAEYLYYDDNHCLIALRKRLRNDSTSHECHKP